MFLAGFFSVKIYQKRKFSVIPVAMEIYKLEQRIFAKRVTFLSRFVKIVLNNTLGRN